MAFYFPEQSYESFDGSTLHEQKCVKVQEYMPDDGDGKIEVKTSNQSICKINSVILFLVRKLDSKRKHRKLTKCSLYYINCIAHCTLVF